MFRRFIKSKNQFSPQPYSYSTVDILKIEHLHFFYNLVGKKYTIQIFTEVSPA
jgi:hypothetical protein